eukprot:7793931-Heterocapsa_arctica.AAC.1
MDKLPLIVWVAARLSSTGGPAIDQAREIVKADNDGPAPRCDGRLDSFSRDDVQVAHDEADLVILALDEERLPVEVDWDARRDTVDAVLDECGVVGRDVPDRSVCAAGDRAGAGQGRVHDLSEVNSRGRDAMKHAALLAAEVEVGFGGRCQ